MQKLAIVFVLSCAFLLPSCQSGAQTKLGPDDFQATIEKETTEQIVDVRAPEEFNGGHIEGAANINFHDADFAQQLAKLDKTRPVMVYCAVGGRSGKAAAQLSQSGFAQVFDLKGGMGAWREKGKPVVK